MVSEQTRQLVTETLQQVTRSAEGAQGQTPNQEGSSKDEPGEVPQGSAHGIQFFSPRDHNTIRLFAKLSLILHPPGPCQFLRTSTCSPRGVHKGAGLDRAGSVGGVQPHYHLSGGVQRGVTVGDLHYQSAAGAAADDR